MVNEGLLLTLSEMTGCREKVFPCREGLISVDININHYITSHYFSMNTKQILNLYTTSTNSLFKLQIYTLLFSFDKS